MKEQDFYQDSISAEDFFLEMMAHSPVAKPPPPPKPPKQECEKKHVTQSGKQSR